MQSDQWNTSRELTAAGCCHQPLFRLYGCCCSSEHLNLFSNYYFQTLIKTSEREDEHQSAVDDDNISIKTFRKCKTRLTFL